MLGLTVVGFEYSAINLAFALLIGLGLAAGYALLGATWLIIKSEGELQLKAVRWARASLWLTALGIAGVSIATPLVSTRIFDKWFSLTVLPLLLPIPLATALLFFVVERSLRRLPQRLSEGNEYGAWIPFACTVGIFFLAFYGLAYSLFPYLVIDRITIWQAAAAPESLMFILVGTAIVLPAILGYTAYAYRVFWGKTRALDVRLSLGGPKRPSEGGRAAEHPQAYGNSGMFGSTPSRSASGWCRVTIRSISSTRSRGTSIIISSSPPAMAASNCARRLLGIPTPIMLAAQAPKPVPSSVMVTTAPPPSTRPAGGNVIATRPASTPSAARRGTALERRNQVAALREPGGRQVLERSPFPRQDVDVTLLDPGQQQIVDDRLRGRDVRCEEVDSPHLFILP